MSLRTKKIALIAIFAAITIVLSILENTIMNMMNFAVPGVKPGFANIAVILALYYLGVRSAGVIAIIKCTAVFFATGTVSTLLFSLSGTMLSLLGMVLLMRITLFSFAGISALGGFLSNAGQLLVMALISETAMLFWYLPILTFAGVGFGLLIGIVVNMITKRIPKAIIAINN